MACLLALLAVVTPRLVIVVLAIFRKYLHQAYDSALWPILGFFFAPYTTLAYTWAMNAAGGVKGPFWIVLMIVAVLVDVASIREGRRQHRLHA